MSLADLPDPTRAVELLRRSLDRRRIAHAYLFTGRQLATLENTALELAMALNCEQPVASPSTDSCGHCSQCRRIRHGLHPDVLWIRPESKLRVITIDQIREITHATSLKPAEAHWKIAVIVGADRLNAQAANAFLKTLEEPPGQSILILLATNPQHLLETILSRCLRLDFAGDEKEHLEATGANWLGPLAEAMANSTSTTLLPRYHFLAQITAQFAELRANVRKSLESQSPLANYDDLDPKLRDRWEHELEAAIEAEYRRQRATQLSALQWFFRDVWLETLSEVDDLLALPNLAPHSSKIAARIGQDQALHNLATIAKTVRTLETSIQENLVLEVSLLQLKL